MRLECPICSTLYDDKKYNICPRCQETEHYELGLKISRENKKIRTKKEA